MAKKKAAKPQTKKKPRIAAWQELVNLLKASRYVQKVTILAKLKALGYDLNENSVSYVMTAARKQGKLCVYTGPKQGYTSTPSGIEALVDIRKRRRISRAWLKNVGAVIRYVKGNIAKLTQGMTPADTAELRKEIKYNEEALKGIERLHQTNGLH
jgi:ATP-dependent Zn protease